MNQPFISIRDPIWKFSDLFSLLMLRFNTTYQATLNEIKMKKSLLQLI